jgi:hypothetical protein
MNKRTSVTMPRVLLLLALVVALVLALALPAFAAWAPAPSASHGKAGRLVKAPAGIGAVKPTPGSFVRSALLIEDAIPWSVYFGTTDFNRVALDDLGIPYKVINSAGLLTVDLTRYSMVIYASDQPASYYVNVAKRMFWIENYVKYGGVLVAHSADSGWNYGTWYGLKFLPGGGTRGPVRHIEAWNNSLSIVDPFSPIVAGAVSNAGYLDNWNFSSHGYFTNVPAGFSTVIADSDGPTYVQYPVGIGQVLATLQPLEFGYGMYGRTEILYNEFDYAQSMAQPRLWRP